MSENETTLVVVMEFDKIFHTLYGTPEVIYAVYKANFNSNSIIFETIVLFSFFVSRSASQ